MNLSKELTDKRMRFKFISVGVGLVVLILLLSWFIWVRPKNASRDYNYQAVFLEGGQVYFGELKIGREWLTLRDVFYLQASEPSVEEKPNLNFLQSNFQLVKLGSEVHGPADEIHFSPSKVLYWENMKEDSKVVEAIKRYRVQ